jgi:hypothetical protein
VPASNTKRWSPHQISRVEVLPPYLTVSGAEQATLPRTPQNRTKKSLPDKIGDPRKTRAILAYRPVNEKAELAYNRLLYKLD